MKSRSDSFEKCDCVPVNADTAIWRAGASAAIPNSGDTLTPMQVGNTEGTLRKQNEAQREQRPKHFEKGAYFSCQSVGCRPWKHQTITVTNLDVQEEDNDPNKDSDSKSES